MVDAGGTYKDQSLTMAPMQIPELTALVERYFRDHPAEYGLVADRVGASFVLNWGGFVNHSFTISDGTSYYHLKLGDQRGQRGLRQWQACHDILEARYHAPRMLGWVHIPGTDRAGPAFEHISGTPADFDRSPSLLRQVLGVVASLHRDQDLIDRLAAPPTSCSETFAAIYIDRFDEDLEIIRADPPPFVSTGFLHWMEEETRGLENRARADPSFAIPAECPVHRDLWADNIRVASDTDWYLLDWDDLGVGDPACDYSVLLHSQLVAHGSASWQDSPILAGDPGLVERAGLYQRAILLDGVIDALADYLDATVASEASSRANGRNTSFRFGSTVSGTADARSRCLQCRTSAKAHAPHLGQGVLTLD